MYSELIRQLVSEGKTRKQISDIVGLSYSRTCVLCKKYGINLQKASRNTIDKIKETIMQSGFEYVSGYRCKKDKVLVRCPVCNGTFERVYHTFTDTLRETFRKTECPYCVGSQRKAKELETMEQKKRDAQLRDERKAIAKAEADSRKANEELAERLAIHVCKVCGVEFCKATTNYNSNVYCSEVCQTKNYRNAHDLRRQRRMNNREHDKGITLKKLYERDHGTCYLCGGLCCWEDKQTRSDGHIVVGTSYPSIDHVIPLSKGGLHKWNNVKLAHMECNALKSDGAYQGG